MGKSISGVSFQGGNRIPSLKGGLKIRKKWDFCGFAEKGHLDYYSGSPVCEEKKGKIKGKKGWKEASMKKKMKLVKGLVKDLEEFSQLGFGLQVDCDEGLAGQNDKSKKISVSIFLPSGYFVLGVRFCFGEVLLKIFGESLHSWMWRFLLSIGMQNLFKSVIRKPN